MTSARTTMRRGAGAVALLSALLLALSVLLLAPAAAAQDAQTCRDLDGFEENDEDDTSGEWGSITFDQDDGPLLLTVNEGYTVELCLKKGTEPVVDGPYEGPLEDVEVNYPGAGEDGFSHYSLRLVEDEPEEADVTLVKRWQDADGASTDAPADVEWEATLTLDDGDDTMLTISDATSDTDTATTDDETAYTVAEDDSSEDFDEVACSEAVRGEIAGTYGDADTIAYGTGSGAVDGDTVHVVCNTVPEEDIGPGTWDLTVEKDVDGPGNPGPYTFDVTCDDGTEATLSLSDGESDTVTGIAEDTDCTVTETNAPAGATVTITTSDGDEVDGTTIDTGERSEDLTVSYVNAFGPSTPSEDEVDVDDDEVVRPSTPDEPDDVAVLPNVVEKPTPTPAPAVAAQELPMTGLSSTQLLLLAFLLLGLGGVMLLGPETRHQR